MENFNLTSKQKKREYASRCKSIAKDTSLPFELVLSLGEKAKYLKGYEIPVLVSQVDFYTLLGKKAARTKEVIKRILGDEIYYKSGIHDFGYVGANRVARWLVGQMIEDK